MTAVIVHYRGGVHLDRCVESCVKAAQIGPIMIVDNEGIGDALRARFVASSVQVLDMPANVGFGRAANAGVALAKTEAVLVLNQDVVLPSETLDAMLAAGEQAKAWIVGPRLRDAAGEERSRKHQFPPPLRWTAPAPAPDNWRYAPYVAGAVMLFTPGHTDLRFDERFFMYGEDEDICWRVWQDGGCVIALENAWADHAGGTATATKWSPRMNAWRVVLNRGRFVRKHSGWSGWARWATQWLVSTLRAKARQARAVS